MTHIFNTKMKIIVQGKKIPVVCPVCHFVLRDKEDVKSVEEETACSDCVLNFKYTNSEKWSDGWRPSVDEARKKMHI